MRAYATLAAAALAVGVLTAQGSNAKPETRAQDVAVTVTYTGSGKVDDTHQIWVFLFDHPNVGPESRPVGTEALSKNGEAATFQNVSTDPVYVFAIYDAKGSYDGTQGPPPQGSPAGMYTTDGKSAAPVKPGSKVKVSFGDETRME